MVLVVNHKQSFGAFSLGRDFIVLFGSAKCLYFHLVSPQNRFYYDAVYDKTSIEVWMGLKTLKSPAPPFF